MDTVESPASPGAEHPTAPGGGRPTGRPVEQHPEGPEGPERSTGHRDGWDTAWNTVDRLTGRLDRHSTLPADQRKLLQLLKITEEAGEVAEAVIGATGQNPRKGYSHTWRDVEAEVCDVIVAAMVALTRLNPDARSVFATHLEHITRRDLMER